MGGFTFSKLITFSDYLLGGWILLLWIIFSLIFFIGAIGEFLKLKFLTSLVNFSCHFRFLLIYFFFTLLIVGNIFLNFLPLYQDTKDSNSKTEETVADKNKNQDTLIESSLCTDGLTIAPLNTELIENSSFNSGMKEWSTQVWYNKADDQYNQIKVTDAIVLMNASSGNPNSRAGLLQELGYDVSGADEIVLKVKVKAQESTLGGSGQQGREAPVAVGVTYYDKDCNLHSRLPESPDDTLNRMFWHGFYFQNPKGSEITVNATNVKKGNWYVYEYDLSDLNPVAIMKIGIEGAGWAPRKGSVNYVSLKVK